MSSPSRERCRAPSNPASLWLMRSCRPIRTVHSRREVISTASGSGEPASFLAPKPVPTGANHWYRRCAGAISSVGRAPRSHRGGHGIEARIAHSKRPSADGGLRFASMRRQCDRPGCSAPAALVYRMVPERLVFWMAPIEDEADTDGGVICQRHADRLVLPRGWTLDDRRDPTLRLFRPSLDPDGSRPPRRARRAHTEPTGEQLAISVDQVAPPTDTAHSGEAVGPAASAESCDESEPASHERSPEADATPAGDTSRPVWAPARGTSEAPEVEVRSSLLARAFGLKRRG